MVTVDAALYGEGFKQRLQHIADIVVEAQSLRDDAQLVRLSTEPHTCSGLLRLTRFTIPGLIAVPVSAQMLLLVRPCLVDGWAAIDAASTCAACA